MDFLKVIKLDDLANLASIVALVLTIVIFMNLRSIRRFYKFTARVPELLNKLIQHARKISEYQKDFATSHREIDLEIAEAEVVLKSLKNKVNRQTISSISRVLKTIKTYNRQRYNSNQLWEVYIEMHKLIAEIHELQSDLKWEK